MGARLKWLAIVWSFISGLTHVTWELGWCIISHRLHKGMVHFPGWLKTWWLYGIADHRYLHSDPFILILEWVTGVLCSTLNFYVVYLFLKKRNRQATLMLLVVSVMEVYGTVMYFGSEYFNDFRNVDTHSVVNAWVKFFGLNFLWVIFPSLFIYEGLRYFWRRPQLDLVSPLG